ncbi:DUF1493 family protein [Cronobacter sakazakii]|uniref:DUF1493 family protein n=1 Tax=Cronobacter sakazakii TaxID=28141 RepID=UPI000CFC64B2|nr:DUF1493 family protein [Cronobacter sakazakii]ELQ6015989.1 DUF1493 family protein [Cronobacter sakazakii]ELY4798174.1 DUF1493 family protein [Cronobacter sakazakii]ELY5803445.1 DUF1493 family protein [Cronobacter sakazakii]HDU8040215.1 DUF1493 family protein [Cronobacter sakazakii]
MLLVESFIYFMNAFYIFSWLGHIDLINIMKPLLPASMRIKRVAPAPLTLRMLAESAKAGHWLYE